VTFVTVITFTTMMAAAAVVVGQQGRAGVRRLI
jgi:hypothetical protein